MAASQPPRPPPPPLTVALNAGQFAARIDASRPGYTPEWTDAVAAPAPGGDAGQAPAGAAGQAPPGDAGQTPPGSAGAAFTQIMARQLEIQAEGLNAAPSRLQLEFLDRLGAGVLPAQSARAALVFKLQDSATADAAVPAGTRVAAVVAPPPPSVDDGSAPAAPAPAPEFFTEQTITALRGRLGAVYSIDPNDDVYVDHSAAIGSGFTLFQGMAGVPHRLYLGHAELFRLAGTAEINLSFDFAATRGQVAPRPLLLEWEYLSANGWLPLTLIEDRTQRFRIDGELRLAKLSGPDAAAGVIAGIDSFWLRASVSSRVPSARLASTAVSATADGFELQVEHTRELLPGDVVSIDSVTRARILRTTDDSVLLDALPAGIVVGVDLQLADALPPLRPEGADEEGSLPKVDTIRARVGFARSELVLDAALLDGFDVDVSKDFRPFGLQPARFASFYIACKDAFSRPGARVDLQFNFTDPGTNTRGASLAVEYFNGTRWVALGGEQQFSDGTANFSAGFGGNGAKAGRVSFLVPLDWAESEQNANKQFWLRFRLAAGDYGQPREVIVQTDPADASKFTVSSVAATLAAPVVATLNVGYVVFSSPLPLQAALIENDFAITDCSEQARWQRGSFAPFTPVLDRQPALHLGFTVKPPSALISLLVVVSAAAADAGQQAFVWDYWSEGGWAELSVRDTSAGLRQTGLLQFVGAPDAAPRDGLGGALYRIRGRLKTGVSSQDQRSSLAGLWLNAVWAVQGTRYDRDGLGLSNGEPDQCFALPAARSLNPQASAQAAPPVAHNASEFERALDLPPGGVPVMPGEVLEVREWTGRGDDWRSAAQGVPADRLRFETDPQDPAIRTALWVRWEAAAQLFDAGAQDRRYTVERSRGLFRFAGLPGRRPPAGAPIVVSYVTGGGIAGNVQAGAIRELRSGVGFIEAVHNPMPAGGGAQAELLRPARERSAQSLRHRDRAVSREDFEWLARDASPEVALARALPLAAPEASAGHGGRGSRGFVGLLIVPQSSADRPMPSAELGQRVLAHVRQRAPAGIAGGITLLAPRYVPVGVNAHIEPQRADEAGLIEARVRARLQAYLHPLAGGREGRGWAFGVAASLSEVAALIQHTPGVGAIHFLQLMRAGAAFGDSVPVQPDELVCAGPSQLKLLVPSLSYASA